jgi:glutamyl-tRNA reductase
VIGNGRVGVSAGRLLQKAGAQVSVTRRKQHHGADPVPREMRTVDYDDRVPYLRTADIVIGATRSPHYTLRAGEASGPLSDGRKRLLIDLAVPADFEPSLFELGRTEGVTLETILSQGSAADPDRESIREAKRILKEEIQKWHLQREKRACLPVIRDAASAVAARVARRCERDLSGETDPDKRLNIVRENSEQAIFSMLADLSEGESDAFAERLQAYLRRKRADGSSLMESVTGS